MKSHAEQKADAEILLKSARKFAEKMLEDFGEFLPYGELLRPNGQIVCVGATTGEEWSKSKDLITILRDAYRAEAKAGNMLACAIVYDVKIASPGGSEKKDAVAFEIDHRDGYSVKVFFPYSLDSAQIQFDPPFAQRGANGIFQTSG